MSARAECPELDVEGPTQDGLLELLSRLPQITSDAARGSWEDRHTLQSECDGVDTLRMDARSAGD
jgi:hypothetical protein